LRSPCVYLRARARIKKRDTHTMLPMDLWFPEVGPRAITVYYARLFLCSLRRGPWSFERTARADSILVISKTEDKRCSKKVIADRRRNWKYVRLYTVCDPE
jgi:hypothetical protein